MTIALATRTTGTRLRAAAQTALALATALALGGVMQAAAASFDCAKAATAVEKLICGEWLLGRLDERMAELYERAQKAPDADDKALLAAQRAWLETRDACTDTACLEQAYRARIAALGGGPEGNKGKVKREVVEAGAAVQLIDKRGDLDIEAIFPVLPGDDAATRAANTGIEQAFREPLEGFRKQYAEFLAENDGIHLGPPWAFSLGYEKVYTTDTLIAVDGGGYMYTGGAHGGALYLPLVLDRKTGKPLEPAALFRAGSDWLAPLAEHARAALQKEAPFNDDSEMVDDDWFQQGTAPTAENYGLLLPTADGIRVTFSQYQVGPYAIGDFRVTVPYAALRDVLSPPLFPEQTAAPGPQ
ncbi:MAG: DUF3298 domain-containing protein [Thiohalocapsa sp.]|jgi:uncharacterized protein|uniref:DUF3298 domain-containing protein n=1 Tax=Thiohalocapsa sp. TaxID=2497641 RepID=UPI0025EAF16E|nr:DUF3298 domain-containing protein [Thiohalocapsa sp.]MCG6941774.1 DUF3298 domain-containing protein [Thiohalocapsa sp.]